MFTTWHMESSGPFVLSLTKERTGCPGCVLPATLTRPRMRMMTALKAEGHDIALQVEYGRGKDVIGLRCRTCGAKLIGIIEDSTTDFLVLHFASPEIPKCWGMRT